MLFRSFSEDYARVRNNLSDVAYQRKENLQKAEMKPVEVKGKSARTKDIKGSTNEILMSDLEKFDMFKFGQLVNQVETLQNKVDAMDRDIKELLELANKSRGGFWMGMTIASGVGGLITFITNHWMGK